MAQESISPRASTQTEIQQHPNGGWEVRVSLSGSRFDYVMNLGRYPGSDQEELVVRSVAIEPPIGSGEPLAVSPPVLRELADRFERLEQHARSAITMAGGNAKPAARTRRELSPAFLRNIAKRHSELRNQGLPPTQTLAREERVSPGTVKHWLRKAKELKS